MPTEREAAYFAERAKGGVALMITAFNVVHENGWLFRSAPRDFDDAIIPKYRMVLTPFTSTVQRSSASWATLAVNRRAWFRSCRSSAQVTVPARMLEMPKKAEPEDIEELIQAHANAAVRAREGGYDGVEIHSAYGGRITRRKNRAPNGHPQTVEKPLVDLGLAAIEHHSLDCHALSQKRPKHVLVKSSPVPRDGGGRRQRVGERNDQLESTGAQRAQRTPCQPPRILGLRICLEVENASPAGQQIAQAMPSIVGAEAPRRSRTVDITSVRRITLATRLGEIEGMRMHAHCTSVRFTPSSVAIHRGRKPDPNQGMST